MYSCRGAQSVPCWLDGLPSSSRKAKYLPCPSFQHVAIFSDSSILPTRPGAVTCFGPDHLSPAPPCISTGKFSISSFSSSPLHTPLPRGPAVPVRPVRSSRILVTRDPAPALVPCILEMALTPPQPRLTMRPLCGSTSTSRRKLSLPSPTLPRTSSPLSFPSRAATPRRGTRWMTRAPPPHRIHPWRCRRRE